LPAMAQRQIEEKRVIHEKHKESKAPTDTLWPGQADTASTFVLIADSSGGYVLGTNSFHDICKGQQFRVDTGGYIIDGAIFWFGEKNVGTGDDSLKFVLWGMDSLHGYTMAGGNQPCPGTELTAITIPMSAVDTSSSLQSAFAVTFPAAITVIDDYMIGFDMSKIGNGTIGLMSTSNGSGGGNELVWEKWSTNNTWHTLQAAGWGFPALLDIDAMILPVIDMSSAGMSEPPMINGISCSAYPNPASETVNLLITLEASSFSNIIEVLDANSRRVFYQNTGMMNPGQNKRSIDVSGWPAGSYICIFYSGSGNYAIRISIGR
jgi:hypothetical protein